VFNNVIIFYFDKKVDIFDNFLFKKKNNFSTKKIHIHFFCLDHLACKSLYKRIDDLGVHLNTNSYIIDICNIQQFKYRILNAVYIPYLCNTDVMIEDNNMFRSSQSISLSDFLILKAYEEGIWVLKSMNDFNEWLNFNEVYKDRADSPIKQRLIYSEIEYPIIKLNNPRNIHLGYGSRIYSRAIILNQNDVFIGRGAHIGCDCELILQSKFYLGSFSIISSNFSAIGQRHTITNLMTYCLGRGPFGFLGDNYDTKADIRIGSDVWIGTRVTVLPGVNIGHGAVIGAGSVVTKDISPYSINAGNPAKEVGKRFSDDVISFFLELKWWDWPSKKIYNYRKFFLHNIDNKSVGEISELLKNYNSYYD